MLDFATKIKTLQIAWVKRFLDKENVQWKYVLSWTLQSFGGELLFQSNCLNMLQNVKMSKYYKEALGVWVNFKKRK